MLVLVLTGLAAVQGPLGSTTQAPSPVYGPPAPQPDCRHPDKSEIIVCGQRSQGYRPDASVTGAAEAARVARRNETAPLPRAQAACASQPTGCANGLAGFDMANAAAVLTKMAVHAAKGEDWKQPLRHGGPDEYQLYVKAKRKREEAQRLVAAERARAQAQAAASAFAPTP